MTRNILLIISIVAIFTLVYFAGKQNGYATGKEEATNTCTKMVQDRVESMNAQIDTLNSILTNKGFLVSKEVSSLMKDTQEIKKQLKNQPQPLVFVEGTKCTVSPGLLEARRKIIERVNQ